MNNNDIKEIEDIASKYSTCAKELRNCSTELKSAIKGIGEGYCANSLDSLADYYSKVAIDLNTIKRTQPTTQKATTSSVKQGSYGVTRSFGTSENAVSSTATSSSGNSLKTGSNGVSRSFEDSGSNSGKAKSDPNLLEQAKRSVLEAFSWIFK